MIDIRLIRENPDLVRENIHKKFQDAKLPLVDEVIELDKANRAAINEASNLRAERNSLSKKIGMLMGQAKKDPSKLEEAEAVKAQVTAQAARLAELEKQEEELEAKIHKIMLTIPQIIDPSVPLGPDDSCNVEVQRFGEAVVPDFPIPYHTEIMERFDGIDLDAARRVSGNGFYYLMGDIARLHEAVLAYARDFMIGKGFTYCIPPFMIHGNVVEGVMSQTDMDAMMYKIEGEDLYLIGTSEHSMIGRYIDQILTEDHLPQTMTSYSPCFRKEKGAHGIEERGVYRIHQFEKQEMIVVCRPEESMDWYEKLWRYSVELFRSLDIPVRQLECCSGDLADLKVKSCDIEAWSPRQQKYFEVCSCSNLGDAQAHGRFLATKALEPERQLVEHLVRHDLVVRMLEHKADAPCLFGKRDVLQGRVPEAHRAADRAVRREAGLELAQESRFAAAALAAEDGDRPLRDREREVIERRARLARIGKRQMFERKRRHVSASFPSSSSGRKHSSAKHAMHTAPSAPSPPMRIDG